MVSNIATGNGTNAAGAGGGVVLGQIGDSILYYQNDQNQTFQLWAGSFCKTLYVF